MSKVKLGMKFLTATAGSYALYRLLKSRRATATLQPQAPANKTAPDKIPSPALLLDMIYPALQTRIGLAPFERVDSVASARTPNGKVESPATAMTPALADRQLKLAAGLVGAIWASGLVGHYTRLKEWPGVYLYVLGTFGLTRYMAKQYKSSKPLYLTDENLKAALTWGGLVGTVLFASDVGNTFMYYRRGGPPMKEMEEILVRQKFLALFPVLIVAEEFLWRGVLLSALIEKGVNKHAAVALTNFLYTVNHFFVAPVGLKEKALMAGMAVPIGFANGYMTLKTKNLWSGVLNHMLTMVSMTLDLFVIPKLARPVKQAPAKTEA
jgi:membrane protease YdiL (CAAX protease family)